MSIRRLGSNKQEVMSLADAKRLLTAEAVPPDLHQQAGATAQAAE